MKNYLIEHTDENMRLDFQNKIDVYDLDKELAHFQWNPEALILDAGCGNGNVIEKLLSLGMKSIHGVDFSEERIKQAQARFNSQKEVHLFKRSLENTDFASNTYDIIICRYIYEHIPNPVNIIKELNRILKPGGLIYIINFDDIFFNFYTKDDSLNQDLKKLKSKLPQDFEIARKIPQFLKQNGFQDIAWDAETFFFKGERLKLEMENNRMRLEQGKGHLSKYFPDENKYLDFSRAYLNEMQDDCNVMAATKYLIKARKTG
ncbi:hypothetical protein C0V70_09365 [Bacteriovorax stolpii]|uniref:Uncharacterized protein n=1 Tax=Bacteriovorax stolpii TaxID=960 RepID=A0A2K9NS34_BACTC|nr:class I SAM-dependent methyltransferase [Bacteriovorax stolpii]AUN98308.1 hypothetical protein C0V70_09365 [Bacteriovorax stolpii]TDP52232.1 methyltransferase family protein [Bacteriovorax stolpii]